MKKEQEIVRIDLTPEQKDLVKKEIGKDADAVELTVSELEERIAPKSCTSKPDGRLMTPPSTRSRTF